MSKKKIDPCNEMLLRHCERYLERFGRIKILSQTSSDSFILPLGARIQRRLLSDRPCGFREEVTLGHVQSRSLDRPDENRSDTYSREAALRFRRLGTSYVAEQSQSTGPTELTSTTEDRIALSIRPGDQFHIFVTGDGGTGKTEFVRYVAFALAKRFVEAKDKSTGVVPVFFDLQGLGKSEQLLTAFCDEQLDITMLETLVQKGRLVLILDGLDELNGQWDLDEFDSKLTLLLRGPRFGECSAIIAGRDSALRQRLAEYFQTKMRLRLVPLTFTQVIDYIRQYFLMRDSQRGEELISALGRSPASIRSLLDRPFMLALTCQLFADCTKNISLPGNPATLMQECLENLLSPRFSGKRSSRIRLEVGEALSHLAHLAAFCCEQGFQFTGPSPSIPVEPAIVNELDLHSGILTSTDGQKTKKTYYFSNRVVAEFLAGQWIAEHGRPHDPHESGADKEKSICNFFSEYIWSNEKRELLRWLCRGLWQSDRGKLLLRLTRWLLAHIKQDAARADYTWRKRLSLEKAPVRPDSDSNSTQFSVSLDDKALTLTHRLLDLFSVMQINGRSTDSLTSSAAQQFDRFFAIVNPNTKYCDVVDPRLFGGLPDQWAIRYRTGLLDKFDACPVDGLGSWRIGELATQLVEAWPGDEIVLGSLFSKLSACMNLALHWNTVTSLAKAMAIGWTGNLKVRDRLLNELARCDDVSIYKYAIVGLSEALVAGWPNDCIVQQQVLKKFCECFANDHGYVIDRLARALARGWPGKEHSLVRDALIDTLLTVCRYERDYGRGIVGVVWALADGWPGVDNVELRDLLLQRLHICWDRRDDNKDLIIGFAMALSEGWPGHEHVVIRDALIRMLCAIGKKPVRNRRLIVGLAGALARGWPGEANASIRELLLGIMRSSCMGPKRNGKLIAGLSNALSLGWPRCEEVRDVLLEQLRVAVDARVTRWLEVISSVEHAGSEEQPEQAAKDGSSVCFNEPEDGYVVTRLAHALSRGWPDKHNGLVRDAVLEAAADSFGNGPYFHSLSQTLATGWPGDTSVAKYLIETEDSYRLRTPFFNLWHDWVVIVGPHTYLEAIANACGWNEEAVSQFCVTRVRAAHADNRDSIFARDDRLPEAFILAPREKLRPGLNKNLLPGEHIHDSEDLDALATLLVASRDEADRHQGRLLRALLFYRELGGRSAAESIGIVKTGKYFRLKQLRLQLLAIDDAVNEYRNLVEQSRLEQDVTDAKEYLISSMSKLRGRSIDKGWVESISEEWPYRRGDLPDESSFNAYKDRLQQRKDIGPETIPAWEQLHIDLGLELRVSGLFCNYVKKPKGEKASPRPVVKSDALYDEKQEKSQGFQYRKRP